jgi:hypothetical protein
MTYKILAVARSLYLIFLVGYTVRALPIFVNLARTHDESYARCAESLSLLNRAAWFAIAWVAFETLLGWWLAFRRTAAPPAPAPSTGTP